MEKIYTIHQNDEQPLYLRIEEILREMIEGIEYEPGDQIPSERELAEKFKVSRMTIRRVIEKLTTQGYLERRSTSGTYVSKPELTRTFNPAIVQSLTRQVHGQGGEITSKLLSFDVIPAPVKIARLLNLQNSMLVYFIKRLRLIRALPFCIEYSYLPKDTFKELSKEMVLGKKSLYSYLKERYGIVPTNSCDKLKITCPTAQEAECLGLSIKDPVLYLRSIVYDRNRRPFEIVKSINHPQRVVFQSETSADDNQEYISN